MAYVRPYVNTPEVVDFHVVTVGSGGGPYSRENVKHLIEEIDSTTNDQVYLYDSLPNRIGPRKPDCDVFKGDFIYVDDGRKRIVDDKPLKYLDEHDANPFWRNLND